MVTLDEVERQLHNIKASFKFWGRAEKRELQHILFQGEQIQQCLNGRWEGGFAMLCATDQRLLLIDKKPMFLSLEDIRYDMVSEVDFSNRLVDATLKVCTPNKNLVFKSFRNHELRQTMNYIQQRVMEIRQHHMTFNNQNWYEAAATNNWDNPMQQPVDGLNPALEIESTVSYPTLQPMNPYTRMPLISRRRVSRFGTFRPDD